MSQSTNKETAAALMADLGNGPFDGMYISAEKLERVIGCTRDLVKYGLALMSLRNAIEQHAEAVSGQRVMTRQEKGGIRFLTAREAAVHGVAAQDNKWDGLKYHHERTKACVDSRLDELSDPEKTTYQQKQEVFSRMLLAAGQVKFQAGITPGD